MVDALVFLHINTSLTREQPQPQEGVVQDFIFADDGSDDSEDGGDDTDDGDALPPLPQLLYPMCIAHHSSAYCISILKG